MNHKGLHQLAQNSWPDKRAVVVSASPSFALLAKELLRSIGWSTVGIHHSVQSAAQAISKKQCFLAIIDDEPMLSSLEKLRFFLTIVEFTGLPALVFLPENLMHQSRNIEKIHPLVCIPKPLSPSTFIPAIRQLIKVWSQPGAILFRQAVSGRSEQVLESLARARGYSGLVARFRALLHSQYAQPKLSERLLLSALRQCPEDLGSALTLSEIYLRWTVPYLSSRIMSVMLKRFPNLPLLDYELAHAYILLGQVERGADHLTRARKNGLESEKVRVQLLKLLLAANREKQAVELMETFHGDLLGVEAWTAEFRSA